MRNGWRFRSPDPFARAQSEKLAYSRRWRRSPAGSARPPGRRPPRGSGACGWSGAASCGAGRAKSTQRPRPTPSVQIAEPRRSGQRNTDGATVAVRPTPGRAPTTRSVARGRPATRPRQRPRNQDDWWEESGEACERRLSRSSYDVGPTHQELPAEPARASARVVRAMRAARNASRKGRSGTFSFLLLLVTWVLIAWRPNKVPRARRYPHP